MDFTGKRNEQLELVEEGEDNLLEIAEKVFNRPPGPSNSIQLELSDDTVNSSSDKTKLVGDIMMCIMLHGIRILYTEEERKQLNEQQFDRVREYMRSGPVRISSIFPVNASISISIFIYRTIATIRETNNEFLIKSLDSFVSLDER